MNNQGVPKITESIEVYPPEFLGLIRTTQLDKPKVDSILERFRAEVSLNDIESEARSIVVTDAGQKDLVKKAHDLRMSLRTERIRIDKARKDLKEGAKREVDLIDGIGRILREKIEPLEAHLQEQEDFAVRQENERLDALRAERAARLATVVSDTSVFDLRGMTDEQFDNLLQVCIDARKTKIAEVERAEAERIADDQRRNDEAAALRAENERLAAERAESERLLNIERQERARVEAESRAADESRQAAIKAEEEAKNAEASRVAAAAKAAELAPDRDKLLAFAADLRSFGWPTVVSPEAADVLDIFKKAMTFALDCFERDVKAMAVESSDCPF